MRFRRFVVGTAAAVAISPFAGSSTEVTTPLDDERRAVATRYATCTVLDNVVRTPGLSARAYQETTMQDGHKRDTLGITLEVSRTEDGKKAAEKYRDDDTVAWYPTVPVVNQLTEGPDGRLHKKRVITSRPRIPEEEVDGVTRQDVSLYVRRDYKAGDTLGVNLIANVWTLDANGSRTTEAATSCGMLVLQQVKAGPYLPGDTSLFEWQPVPDAQPQPPIMRESTRLSE